ncbi:MAG: hypothetical protein EOT04_02640 [Candidatus Chaera renei]|uniref:Nucleotidyl transferase domain-containing protein n=1 Tax=Candidatus Chaera renei TaxID=2506947 RepID=A0A4V1J7J9_9BACT|nr:MAG: hypothetical protein EOT04_02640 [Candidatus Chaera renei]
MIAVIIAGGSGTRLWPLSTYTQPKHLLKLIDNDYSLLQSTYARAKKLSDKVIVITEASHSGTLKKQLPRLSSKSFIVEPGRRGTAGCIVAALDYIARHYGNSSDEPIAFLAADHHIRDVEGFVRSFHVAADVSKRYGKIVLVGVEPTYPATGFGYIEKAETVGESSGVAYRVSQFKEKPTFKVAQQYISTGRYLWNCGYFVGSINTFLKEMKANAPTLAENYDKLCAINDPQSQQYKDVYLRFENQVIDIALIEKAKDLVVIPASFDWMDVGNSNDLHAANELDQLSNYVHGNNIHSVDVENGYIRNEEPEKPIVVIGMDNVVVVNTKDGILISRKDLSPKVGDIAKQIQARD